VSKATRAVIFVLRAKGEHLSALNGQTSDIDASSRQARSMVRVPSTHRSGANTASREIPHPYPERPVQSFLDAVTKVAGPVLALTSKDR
jgi:hypothetical protein